MDNMGYIYLATNTINGKVYVGQTKRDIKLRWKEHVLDANNPNRASYSGHLSNAIRKYGASSFIVAEVEECPDESLDCRETYWIEHYNSMDKMCGYNATSGGVSNYTTRPDGDHSRLKKSLSKIGSNNSFYGLHHSRNTRAKFSTPVVSYTDDGIYRYYASQNAVNSDGYYQSHVTDCVNGKSATHGTTDSGTRLKWRFATDGESSVLKTIFLMDGSTIISPGRYNMFLKEVANIA